MIDFQELSAERRRTAAETMQVISLEDLRALNVQLFGEDEHPWRDAFTKFLDEHGNETAYGGHTGDDVWFVYGPKKRKGLWYLPHGTKGVGILQEGAMDALDEIIAEKFKS